MDILGKSITNRKIVILREYNINVLLSIVKYSALVYMASMHWQ